MDDYGIQKPGAVGLLTWVLDMMQRFQAALNPTHDFSRKSKGGEDGADTNFLFTGWVPSDGRRMSDKGTGSLRNSRRHTTDLLMIPLGGGCIEKTQQKRLGEQCIEMHTVQSV